MANAVEWCLSPGPSIDEFPDDIYAIEGEDVVFKVTVSGRPVLTLTWYHHGSELVSTPSREVLDDGSLYIPCVDYDQEGVYTLVATNSEGTVEEWVELMVDSEEEWEEWEEEEETEGTTEPVPVWVFRDYVAKKHANSNEGFRNQFQVMGIALLGVGGG